MLIKQADSDLPVFPCTTLHVRAALDRALALTGPTLGHRGRRCPATGAVGRAVRADQAVRQAARARELPVRRPPPRRARSAASTYHGSLHSPGAT